ncbi:MAG TPA: carboxyltransferase domain-containing protein [Thermoanaerobaculia bacterium]|nr:carboxyltransferase domain-containing protein [Thermoanaerobaculia bacterium]
MKAVPAGDNALLVELGEVSAEELHRAARAMRAQPGVVEVIPGHSSLYVIRGEAGVSRTEAVREPREHRLRVAFDGPDLPELLARVPREEFLARVASLRLTVRYLGFRGGFAYLDGWPEEWAMPRRPTSRPVMAGSFAVAGSVAGFYPIDTPGGWNVLGRTDADVEDAFVPGDTIVLLPTELDIRRRQARRLPLHTNRAELVASPLAMVLENRAPFDDIAAALALRAVQRDVELFECAMTGPRLRFTRDAVTAWCDPALNVRVQRVRAGEELAIGRIAGGLRGYLALGDEEGIVAKVARGDRHVIHAWRGPHDVGLGEVECDVTPQLDRVGVRLRPRTPLQVAIPADLRSSGMQTGTVQLHPDGSLVAMGPDHPVTGGYLQVMTVLTAERWKLAQLVPGERVTLVASTPEAPAAVSR